MKIATSIAAMNALNAMSASSRELRDITQRLSSGLSINSAADAPAGLAIVSGMKSHIAGLRTGVINMQDGLNMLRTSEAGLAQATAIAMRIRDLVVRGANEATLTSTDRQNLQSEIDSLIDEMNRSAGAATYNTKHVNMDDENFSPMVNNPASITVNHSGVGWPGPGDAEYDAMVSRVQEVVVASMEKVYGMLGLTPDPSMGLTINFTDIDGNGSVLATGGIAGGSMVINVDIEDWLEPYDSSPAGANIGYAANDAFTYEQVMAHEMTHAIFLGLGGVGGSAWGQEMLASVVSQEADRRISSNPAGIAATVNGTGNLTAAPASSSNYAAVALAGKFIVEKHGASALRDIAQKVIDGSDFDAAIEEVLADDYDDFAAFETAADEWSLDYINGGSYSSVSSNGLASTTAAPNETQANIWSLQISGDAGDYGSIDLATPWSSAGSLDYAAYASVASQEQATRSIAVMDKAIAALSKARALVGIQENAINRAINDAMNQIANTESSRMKIEDADFAAEITRLTRASIISSSSANALASSNNLYRNVLDLINGLL